jgi:transposase InsO family protein
MERAGAIRYDNGPEFTSRHFLAWAVERQIELIHIQPGKPTQNARVESFHGAQSANCVFCDRYQALLQFRLWDAASADSARAGCDRQHLAVQREGVADSHF